MVSIYNGTAHAINIYNINDTVAIQDGRKLGLKPNAVPVLSIEPGTNLNAVRSTAELPPHLQETGLPLKGGVVFLGHDHIPEGYDIVICSNFFRAAVKECGGDTSRLATVNGVIYISENDLRTCGCLGLSVG